MGRSLRAPLAALAAVSVVLLVLRAYAATQLGFGDSEALYASYALHPQPAYLDHPGMIGLLARVLGGGTSPTPLQAHLVTALLATAFPWGLALAARACGASGRASLWAALIVAVTPEMAIGLFAMTPDLLLAYAWTGALGLASFGLRLPARSTGATLALAVAGLLAGVATASKVTGAALFVALAAAYVGPRAHRRSFAPWAGLAAGLVVVMPIARFEAERGWPMLHHRLVDTQSGAAVSLRNAGALLGGQLLYLSPVVLVLAVLAARALWRGRQDPVGRLLFAAFVVPLVGLVPLCLWSRVAEPHWLAPPLLAAALAAARTPLVPPRRLYVAAAASAALLVALVHAWILVPRLLALAPASYDARLDISNELRGWPEAVEAVREEADAVHWLGARPGDVVVAGPHWVDCAQLDAALRGSLPVGCDTPIADDFDDWLPRARWRAADVVLWVDDGRFPPPSLPEHTVRRQRQTRVVRADRVVRVFTITVLVRLGQA